MRVVAGKARGTALKTPQGQSTRPTTDRVKEAMFSIIQFDLPGATVLDLFGGTGQLGIEALSRGAKHAVFVDHLDGACKLIKENLKRTKLDGQATVIHSDYLSFLKTCQKKFQIILLDPPYTEVFLENALNLITEIDILQSGGIIVTERPVGKSIPSKFPGYVCSRDYKYGSTLVCLYRKQEAEV